MLHVHPLSSHRHDGRGRFPSGTRTAAGTARALACGKGPKLGFVTFANSGRPLRRNRFCVGSRCCTASNTTKRRWDFATRSTRTPALRWLLGRGADLQPPALGRGCPVAARTALARLAPTPAERSRRLARPANGRSARLSSRCSWTPIWSPRTRLRRRHAEGGCGVSRRLRRCRVDLARPHVCRLPGPAFGRGAYPGSPGCGRIRRTRIRASPEHPGGTHYLIHATDSPATARRGLDAARKHAAIAPDAEHALHMPSHLFLQLGMWDDTTASNERAWAASRAEVAAKKALERRIELPMPGAATGRLPPDGDGFAIHAP